MEKDNYVEGAENQQNHIEFSSAITMGEKEYWEFSEIFYNRSAIAFLVFVWLLSVPLANILSERIDGIGPFVTLLLVGLSAYSFYNKMEKSIKKRYQQKVFSEGQETLTYFVEFSDKITVKTNVHAPIAYEYSTIQSIKECRSFYLLEMQHNVYLIVQKQPECNGTEQDFITYLYQKCGNLKSKEITKVYNRRKNYKIVAGSITALYFLFSIIVIIQKLF